MVESPIDSSLAFRLLFVALPVDDADKLKILVSTAFYKMVFYNLPYSSGHSFNWICFSKIFDTYCQSVGRLCARNIASKSTFR